MLLSPCDFARRGPNRTSSRRLGSLFLFPPTTAASQLQLYPRQRRRGGSPLRISGKCQRFPARKSESPLGPSHLHSSVHFLISHARHETSSLPVEASREACRISRRHTTPLALALALALSPSLALAIPTLDPHPSDSFPKFLSFLLSFALSQLSAAATHRLPPDITAFPFLCLDLGIPSSSQLVLYFSSHNPPRCAGLRNRVCEAPAIIILSLIQIR